MNRGDRILTVVQSFRFGGTQSNPYLTQLVRSLPDSVDVRQFSWWLVLLGRYDVLHVHWPEWMIRRASRVKTAGRLVLLSLALMRLSVSRSVIVRTVHNTTAHEPGHRIEAMVLRRMDRLTRAAIVLNPAAPPFGDVPSTLVLHGDYRDWFADFPEATPESGRLVNFGLIRPYKGVERLLETFSDIADPTLRLTIIGRPSTARLKRDIEDGAAGDERVHLELSYLDDRRLATEITRSSLVVLPYREMDNSGAVLLALSLARPVLVPDTPATRLLRDEVGERWVALFEGSLRDTDILSALERTDPFETDTPPDLSRRTWRRLGEQTAAVYRDAVESRRRAR
ncbi:MAG: hypothetical protein RI885_1324 [Actinomycetota bacterium]